MEYLFCLGVSILLPLFLIRGFFFSLLIFVAHAFLAAPLTIAVFKEKKAEKLNPLLGKTAKFLWVYSLFFSLGILLS